MGKTRSKPVPHRPAAGSALERYAHVTRVAFWLLLVIVAARATMQETLRVPFQPAAPADATTPNEAGPRMPGPATSLGLDLLCCVPALLILARRVLDEGFALRWNWSHVLTAALGLWAAMGVPFAADEFAALIGSANFIAALVVIWSFTQLVRDWGRLRLVAGVIFGLLLIYIVTGVEYRLIELPQIRKDWLEHQEARLRQQGLEPGSFLADRFEKKVLMGDMGSFSNSTNSYAAALVLMGLATAGVAIQRNVYRDGWRWIAPILIILPAYVFVLFHTRSRAGISLGFVGAAALGIIALLRRKGALSHKLYWMGVGVFALGVAAAVTIGLKYNGYRDKSLTFRWYYWTGAARIVAQHPLRGVGWNNFGEHYLEVRGPAAVEEVQDPHNFLVKAFAELGVAGGMLMAAWMLRLWWELTSKSNDECRMMNDELGTPDSPFIIQRPSLRLIALAATAMAFGAAVSIDWGQASEWIAFQAMRYVVGAVLLVVGLAVVVARSLLKEELDQRPAPWLVYAMLVALGMFLLHNLLDFALAENTLLFLAAMLMGSLLGMRQSSRGEPRAPQRIAWIGASCAVLAWLATAGAIGVPTALAENAAAAADDALRLQKPDDAARLYATARDHQPLNGDYSYRLAWALLQRGAPPDKVRQAIEAAHQADPYTVRVYLLSANFELRQRPRDRAAIDRAFDAAQRLDPRNVKIHLEHGLALATLGDADAARRELAEATRINHEVPADEPKRAALETEIEKAGVTIENALRSASSSK